MDSRGFMGIALVLIALIPIFLFANSYLASRDSSIGSKNAALLAEMDLYRRADIRNALISDMRRAAAENGGSPNDTVKHVVNKLSSDSPKIAGIYNESGVEVIFWCGLADLGELGRLPAEMAAEGRAKKCAGCWDFGEIVLGVAAPDSRKPCPPAPACDFLLSPGNRSLRISAANGTRFSDQGGVCEYPAITAGASKPAVFGASIYDRRTNTSSVVILPQGYGVEYG